MPLTNFPNGISVPGSVTIDEDGLLLDNTVWDDLRVPVTAATKGGSKDPDFGKVLDNGAGSQGVFAYLFSASAEEELYFVVQLSHNWKAGTSLHPHVHWLPTANGTAGQVVSWGLEYTISEIGSVFPNTVILFGNTNNPAGTLVANKHYLTSFAEIDLTGFTSVSTMLLCRVFRDATGSLATDDYAADTALLEIDFHYEIERLGSADEYS